MATTVEIDMRYAIITQDGNTDDDTVRYVWDPDKLITPVGGFSSVRVGKGDDCVSLSSLTLNYSWPDEPIFVFYVADCAWPTLHAIQAASWENAYEDFCEQEADRGHYLIKDGDPDYGPDDGTWTDNGRRVDSESFQALSDTFRVVLAGKVKPPK